jgi:hypothetical protein
VSTELPPCGLYRVTKAIAGIPADRLVYFHNHGDPGAGVYFPERWTHNRAHFSPKGSTVPADFDPSSLMPLPAEGFYHFKVTSHCCEKKCTKFEPDQLLQLGYNGNGKALVFMPELAGGVIEVPERGTMLDDAQLAKLMPLKMPERAASASSAGGLSLPRGIVVH